MKKIGPDDASGGGESTEAPLVVKSHVGRDIVQSAQMFKTVEAAVWEYVVNSLQYVDQGTSPEVKITYNKSAKKIVIVDNGAGMTSKELRHFFTMHGENTVRKAGKMGRGKFGTGKSAAFGVGTSLTVESNRNGKRNVAVLTREGIDTAGDGPIPVDHTVKDLASTGANGTRIEIAGVTRSLNVDQTKRRLSRYLSSFRHANPVVSINGDPIEIFVPSIQKTRTFKPAGELVEVLGDIEVTVNVATEALEQEDRGVSITVGEGNLVARTDAGVGSKEWGNYLFGEVDCPALEASDHEAAGQVSPYGGNRDLTLNPEHPVAMRLLGYIGFCLEQVRDELVAESKEAKADEQSKRLQKAADEIAQVLNDDFQDQAERLEAVTSNAHKRNGAKSPAGPEEEDLDNPTHVVSDEGEAGVAAGNTSDHVNDPDPNPEPTPNPNPNPDPNPVPGGENASGAGTLDECGDENVTSHPNAGRKANRGGISVVYEKRGSDEGTHRSYFEKEKGRIVINVEHPALCAALDADGGNVDGKSFRRLSFEVAFTEYALGLARMELDRNPELPGDDMLFEVRDAIRRIAAKSVVLYA